MAGRTGVGPFQQLLDAFARCVSAGPHKTFALVLDDTGRNVNTKVRPPEATRFRFLPPFRPGDATGRASLSVQRARSQQAVR